ncbi:hypothetical protein M3G50_06340 [Brachybacterium muris]|uniref:hypothetical protein n=1 Tax=Brachybacterium muris TaxID=219301 RepID=UPI0021A73D08|nr:hypothetical protein [Brachybacterium muris]
MIAATLLAATPFEDSPFWNPDLPGSFWSVFGILLAGTAVLTIAFVVWMVIQPDEPEHDTTELVDRAVGRERDRARIISRRLDADAGRADTSEPELR